jgi:hypothetical protein
VTYRYKSSPYASYYRKGEISFSRIVIDPNIGKYDLSFSEGIRTQIANGEYDLNNNTTWILGNQSNKFGYVFNLEKSCSVANNALGVTPEIFDYIYSAFKDKKQFALFVEDYAYIDDVKFELLEKNFDSLSDHESHLS